MTNSVDINFPCIHIDAQYSKIYYHSTKIVHKIRENENAIEHDAIDILTEYPPWPRETYDLCYSDEDIYDRNRKEI